MKIEIIMPKILKNSTKAENLRNRVRIFRGIQSILRHEDKQINVIHTPNVPQILAKHHTEQRKSLFDELRSWALKFHIKRRAITGLLKILKCNGMSYLPKDSRTLLQTPRKVNIENIVGGKYWHQGLKNALSPIFSSLNKDITLQMNINIDGLPLYKSSTIEFWPILGNIRGMLFLGIFRYFQKIVIAFSVY